MTHRFELDIMDYADRPLAKLGFLTIGSFDESDPFAGHDTTLRIIDLGEQLGFDSVRAHWPHSLTVPRRSPRR